SGDSVNKEGNGSQPSNDIKVDIPEYDGKLDPNKFVKWLQTVELVFDYKQTTEDNKVKFVALKLRLEHITSECPNKRIITFADFELACGYEFNNETTNEQQLNIATEEEVVGPDEGEYLVIRRTLNTTPIQEETLQRESIFQTRCTIAQRVCTVIIDGGIHTNVASQTLVNKLNLHTEPHPSPYVIQWLNHGKGISVSHLVLLSLSIGRFYTDKIWCDVLPMDSCHVLLGPPWQFDR
nr:hypothetical protein [Tanacetum cinerariifolium]